MNSFVLNLKSLYGWQSPVILATMLAAARGNGFLYLGRFFTTQRFGEVPQLRPVPGEYRALAVCTWLGMVTQLAAGIVLIAYGLHADRSEWLYFGFAVAISYPIVWAVLLPVMQIVMHLRNPKHFGKVIISRMLEAQVVRLRAHHKFRIVAVAGSVGKTSTKLAIAQVLAAKFRVRYQDGNYNDRLTVPLILFGQNEPGIYNLAGWLRILLQNERRLRQNYPYDMAVVELGSDGPGQLQKFAYLQPDVAVVTAVAEEHMEYFGTLDAVATEELSVLGVASTGLLNEADIAARYRKDHVSTATYGSKKSTYALLSTRRGKLGEQRVTYTLNGKKMSVKLQLMGTAGAKIALAAAAVADTQGMTASDITTALSELRPPSGRMQLLMGINESMIIDDTYNASPTAALSALEVLYAAKAPAKVAILGSMNELGASSKAAHQRVGNACNPKKLDVVITIGKEAKKYLAPAAKGKGCVVRSFMSPYEAGNYVKSKLQKGSLVLAKGSQNGVFAEEAVKLLLADPADADKLVRQSPAWLKIKRSQFSS